MLARASFLLLWTVSVSLARYLSDYQAEDQLLDPIDRTQKNVYFDSKDNVFLTNPDKQVEEFLEDSMPVELASKFEEISEDGHIPENELHLDNAIPISTASTSSEQQIKTIINPANKMSTDNSTKDIEDYLVDPGIEEPMVLKIVKPLCDN
uniref:Uncharacterized protein n=1 Tax=Acrobeloides nanus TaxID=290746 RepID=A0A914CL41_9BILA